MSTKNPLPWRTFMFALPGRLDGPLALGTGQSRAAAVRDAYDRLVQMGAAHARGEHGELLRGLQAALARAVAGSDAEVVTAHEASGQYPARSQMGHDYVNNETQIMAAALASDARLAAKMAGVGFAPEKARRVLHAAAGSLARAGEIDLAMVDWSEVAMEFIGEEELGAARPTSLALVQPDSAAVAVATTPESQTRRIEPDVLEVLSRSTAQDNLVRLPAGRMPRELYAKVNAVLVALGGRWKGGKVQAHVFEEDAGLILEVAVTTGTYMKPQDFGYFPTPAELALQVVQLADLRPGMTVLEPSAGRGAIALAAAEIVGKENVTCVELLPRNAGHLASLGFHQVGMQDFLTLEPDAMPKFDRVLMNPPFSRLSDIEHVMHATRFLEPDGRLVAITAPSWEHTVANRRAAAFREFVAEAAAECLSVPAGAFRDAGTEIATRILTFDAENFPWHQREARRERQRA